MATKDTEIKQINEEGNTILNSGSPGNLQDLAAILLSLNGKWGKLSSTVWSQYELYQGSVDKLKIVQGMFYLYLQKQDCS